MASTSQQSISNKPLSMASLLSPPEMKRVDSFSSPSFAGLVRTPHSPFSSEKPLPSIHDGQSFIRGDRGAYASPPISPCRNPQTERPSSIEVDDDSARDPPLFRHTDGSAALPPHVPLFPQERDQQGASLDIAAVVSEHMAKKKVINPSSMPTRSEYMLAVSCVPQVVSTFKKDTAGWLKRERDLLFNYYGKKSKVTKRAPLRKIAPATSSTRKRISIPSVSRSSRVPRTPTKRTPQARVYDSFDSASLPSPKQIRAPTNRDDVDYQSLPDFAPAISTLPKGNSKILKADWKGQMLDLSTDPDRHLLHDAEVNLASTLRLSCATYLCSKRRIFQARIEALRIGKEFRKTDAQQACKIDVNKASKLWSAYDKVGWFNKEYFQRFL